MKRAMEMVELPLGTAEMDVQIREPGIVRMFIMGMREKSGLLVQGNKKLIEEVPVVLAEVDPEGEKRSHRFLLIRDDQAIESTATLVYRGTAQSPHSGRMFHLFEELEGEKPLLEVA